MADPDNPVITILQDVTDHKKTEFATWPDSDDGPTASIQRTVDSATLLIKEKASECESRHNDKIRLLLKGALSNMKDDENNVNDAM